MIQKTENIFPILDACCGEIHEALELYKLAHTCLDDEDISKIKSVAFEMMTYLKLIREIDERSFDHIPF
jgi:hypothetical protein